MSCLWLIRSESESSPTGSCVLIIDVPKKGVKDRDIVAAGTYSKMSFVRHWL